MSAVSDLFPRAVSFHERGNLVQAEVLYRQIVETDPCHPSAHNNLGLIFMTQGRISEAASRFRQALSVNPQDSDAHNNLGNVLYQRGELADAITSYRDALRYKPQNTDSMCNLGNALKDQGHLEAAAACYREALAIDPHHKWTRWNSCLLRLLQGNFDHAWSDFEERRMVFGKQARRFSQPQWDGKLLTGGTILVFADMGLGDTIHFQRFLPLVQKRGGTVVFECQPTLFDFLKNARGIDNLIYAGQPLPAFDVHVPLLSIPGILGTTFSSIPADVPYLQPGAGSVEFWQKELQPLKGFKVGIAWQGNPRFPADKLRSIPLSHFEKLALIQGVQLISLQKGEGALQLRSSPIQQSIVDLGDCLNTLNDTAAVMKNLDLVISSDTCISHLAGALGIPVWTALQLVPDWRWFLNRSESPWYPTMRLFRQSKLGDWAPVFEEITEALRQRALVSKC